MGNAWKDDTLKETELQLSRPDDEDNAKPKNNKSTEVNAVIATRAKDNDVRSLGSVFHRNKDDDTVATKRADEELDEEDDIETTIVFDITAMQQHSGTKDHDNHSLGMSTAGKTTGTTRLKVKELEKMNQQLRTENAGWARALTDDQSIITTKTTQTTRGKLEAAQDELVAIRLQMAELQKQHNPQETKAAPIMPAESDVTGPSDAAMSGVGQDH